MYKSLMSLFTLFIRKKLLVSVTALIMLGVTTGFVSYQTAKNDVTLVANGEQQKLSSHADTVRELLQEHNIDVNPHDIVKPGLDTKLKENMTVQYTPAKKIFLSVNGNTKLLWTTGTTVEDLVKEHNLQVKEHDVIQPGFTAALKNNQKILMKSAVPVNLVVAGKPQQVWTTSTTVADLLKQQKVQIGKNDRIDPANGTKLHPNMQVQVIRVEKVTDVVEADTPFATVMRKDSNIAKGNQRVISPGKNGRVSQQFAVIKENGNVISRKLVKTNTVQKSQDRVIALGTKVIRTVSRSQEVSSGQDMIVSSTAYTASCAGCSGRTVTGFDLRANPNAHVIAVDPRVIPLGSKVYVEGYGYAIAADTGGAIQGNRIDIFFASESQAVSWGRKTIRIRVLN